MTTYARPEYSGSRADDGAGRFVQRTMARLPEMEISARGRYGTAASRDIQLEVTTPGVAALPPPPPVTPSRTDIISLYDQLKDTPHNLTPDQFARLEGLVNGLK